MTYGVERKQYKLQTTKIVAEKQRSSREEKEKQTLNRLSNSSCNLVTSNRLSKSIYKKLNRWVLNPKGGNWMFWWGDKPFSWLGDDKLEREREWLIVELKAIWIQWESH